MSLHRKNNFPHFVYFFSFLVFFLQGKKLPPNIDENAEEGDVSDEDSADEMEDDCKLMNGDVSSIVLEVFFHPLYGFIISWLNTAFSLTGCLTD